MQTLTLQWRGSQMTIPVVLYPDERCHLALNKWFSCWWQCSSDIHTPRIISVWCSHARAVIWLFCVSSQCPEQAHIQQCCAHCPRGKGANQNSTGMVTLVWFCEASPRSVFRFVTFVIFRSGSWKRRGQNKPTCRRRCRRCRLCHCSCGCDWTRPPEHDLDADKCSCQDFPCPWTCGIKKKNWSCNWPSVGRLFAPLQVVTGSFCDSFLVYNPPSSAWVISALRVACRNSPYLAGGEESPPVQIKRASNKLWIIGFVSQFRWMEDGSGTQMVQHLEAIVVADGHIFPPTRVCSPDTLWNNWQNHFPSRQ